MAGRADPEPDARVAADGLRLRGEVGFDLFAVAEAQPFHGGACMAFLGDPARGATLRFAARLRVEGTTAVATFDERLPEGPALPSGEVAVSCYRLLPAGDAVRVVLEE